MKISDVADRFMYDFGAAMDWLARACYELTPNGTTTIETLHEGEAANVRAMLRTHDLLQIKPGAMVTAWAGGDDGS